MRTVPRERPETSAKSKGDLRSPSPCPKKREETLLLGMADAAVGVATVSPVAAAAAAAAVVEAAAAADDDDVEADIALVLSPVSFSVSSSVSGTRVLCFGTGTSVHSSARGIPSPLSASTHGLLDRDRTPTWARLDGEEDGRPCPRGERRALSGDVPWEENGRCLVLATRRRVALCAAAVVPVEDRSDPGLLPGDALCGLAFQLDVFSFLIFLKSPFLDGDAVATALCGRGGRSSGLSIGGGGVCETANSSEDSVERRSSPFILSFSPTLPPRP